MYVPRHVMLVVGLLTCAVGPALVLVVLGLCGAALVCMAFYPIYTVAGMWTCFFLQSQFFQTIGIMFGLDVNGDGLSRVTLHLVPLQSTNGEGAGCNSGDD